MQIITTEDGSHTLFSEKFNEIYHSRHGAIQESRHVFIENGLDYVLNTLKLTGNESVRIFEMGFGTGLNALLTMLEGEKRNSNAMMSNQKAQIVPTAPSPLERGLRGEDGQMNIYYETVELYPVPIETIKALNYTNALGYEFCYGPYHTMHLCTWDNAHPVTPGFTFKKINGSITDIAFYEHNFHVIYFDAFAPEVQPDLWSVEIMKKMYDLLAPGGVLVSYCSKVSFQKALKEAGFTVEKLPGPPGKREMVRAIKR